MAFHDINQGKHFIYCHLMHALMSTCDPMSFKISSVGIRAHTWMTFELHIWVILGFPFSGLEAIFWSFFFIWCWFSVFKPDWCWRLVENIVWSKTFLFYFMVFGAHLMGFRKLGLILVLHFMRFLCNFLGLDWRIDVWGWKLSVFVEKCTKFWPIFFFSRRARLCSAQWRRWIVHDDIILTS